MVGTYIPIHTRIIGKYIDVVREWVDTYIRKCLHRTNSRGAPSARAIATMVQRGSALVDRINIVTINGHVNTPRSSSYSDWV